MSLKRFLKELLTAFTLGSLVFFGFLGYYYFVETTKYSLIVSDIGREYTDSILFFIIIYLFNMSWIVYILKRYTNNIYTLKRFLISISGNILLSFIAVFVGRFLILVALRNRSVTEYVARESIKNYVEPLVLAIVISLIFYAIWFFKYRQENKVKEQKIIAGTASAKFDALKNQLDPHFLFNSLNVLTSLIEEDPYQAQKFTTSLSKVYRYVLEQKNKDLVPVDEELQFAKTYIKLLKMRFEDSIILEIPDNCTNPEAKIIPLSLQLLLENAVKHNVVTSEKPLFIKVFEDDVDLCVTNNIQEKRVVKKSSGVGLSNIQERYAILTDRNVEISKEKLVFSVRLPMLTKKVSTMEVQESYLADKRYEKAKERVETIKGFYGNIIAYCIVIPMLAVLNYNTTGFPWIIFPTLGWGFGVVVHGMEAFGYNPLWGKSWEERKLREYMGDDE